MKTAFFAIL